MNKNDILESAANFNSRHDYDIDCVLEFAAVATRHAHFVQLARVKAQDPQLVLPMDLPQDLLP